MRNILLFLSIAVITNVKAQGDHDEITLIKTVPGGSRAHVIVLKSDGSLTYRIGSFIKDSILSLESIKINSAYSGVDTTLSKIETKKIFSKVKKIRGVFEDKRIVKDAWQFYLFMGTAKKLFYCDLATTKIPKNIRAITEKIYKLIPLKYKFAGTS